MSDLSGHHIKGYDLQECIGEGGFGAVYRAYQAVVDREVAIKVILPQHANHPDFIRRFEAEARMIARLEHLHIVPLYDYWREPNGAFLVMRYLRGGSLKARLLTKGPLSLPETARLVDQLGASLVASHRNQVIHRDLKPANLLQDEEGNIYLSDFGIAKDIKHNVRQTMDGVLVGSPAYLSPEQITSKLVTPCTDIYSFGLVLYECLTGQHPFPDAQTPHDLIQNHLSEPLPTLHDVCPDLPANLDSVIQRATAKDPDDRYPDVLSLINAFRAIVNAAPQNVTSFTMKEDIVIFVETSPAASRIASALGPADVLVTLRNPYKGLYAFEEEDASDFFGRTALIEQLLARLEEDHEFARFLAVVGPSGCGKSSVVKAGLIPALRNGQFTGSDCWFRVEMIPRSQLHHTLAAALLSVAPTSSENLADLLRSDPRGLIQAADHILDNIEGDLLLVIDQFEELFTAAITPDERAWFLDLLTTAVTDPRSRVRVIITLRADFTDRPLQYVEFGELMRQRIEFVLPLSPGELEQAITEPARCVGVRVEPDLLAALLADVADEPGVLPLLQHVLTEIFEQHSGRTLTLQAYQVSGGVTGALARRAETVLGGLDVSHRTMAQQMFLRLVALGEGTEDTRRRATHSELAAIFNDSHMLAVVLSAFGQSRLLTFDHDLVTREPTVEVAHEALIREWTQLRLWLDDSRNDIRLQRRLAVSAAEWIGANRDGSYLLHGAQLAQYADWATTTDMILAPDERAYLRASVIEREQQEAAQRERQDKELALQRRAVRLFRTLTGGMAIFLVVTLGLALWALDERKHAQNEAAIAENRLQENLAFSISQYTQRILEDGNSDLALALALAISSGESVSSKSLQNLYAAAYHPGTRLVFDEHQSPVIDIAISPDGKLAASSSGRLTPLQLASENDHSVRIWKVSTGEVVHLLNEERGGHRETVLGLAFSPDGRVLASGSADCTIILWDVLEGQVITHLEGHTEWVDRVGFTPDGRYLISISGDFLRDLFPLPSTCTDTGGGTEDRTVRLWDVDPNSPTFGEEIRRFGADRTGHQAYIQSLAISPNGEYAVTGDTDGVIIVWNIATGEEVNRFSSPRTWVSNIAFHPNGHYILTGLGTPDMRGRGATAIIARLWDIQTGERVLDLVGHTNAVSSVAISADGRLALTGSGDHSVRLWALDTGDQLAILGKHSDAVFDVAFSLDGQYAFSCAQDNTVRFWNTHYGALVRNFEDTPEVMTHGLDISADGRWAISGNHEGRLILWDVATGQEIRRFGDGSQAIMAVDFSPDGQLAVSGDEGAQAILWDVKTGEELRRFEGHTYAVLDVAFSPDGSKIATSSGDLSSFVAQQDNTVRLWDVKTGAELRRFEGHTDAIRTVAFSPDGTLIASGSGNTVVSTGDSSIRIWEIKTGKQLLVLEGHVGYVGSVAFSPDGLRLVSGGNDSTMRLWDVKTGAELRRFDLASFVDAIVFDPDGRTLIGVSAEDRIQVWDAVTGQELHRLTGYKVHFVNLAVTADGRRLLTSSANGELSLWDINRNADELRDWIFSNRYVRDLSCEERFQYYIEPLCE